LLEVARTTVDRDDLNRYFEVGWFLGGTDASHLARRHWGPLGYPLIKFVTITPNSTV
jgi:hypothetical protein